MQEQVCAELDASARCRNYGIILQQRLATERTRRARRGRRRSLYRICPCIRQRSQGAGMPRGLACAGVDLAFPRRGEGAFGTAIHKQITRANFDALYLAYSETLFAVHINPDLDQPA